MGYIKKLALGDDHLKLIREFNISSFDGGVGIPYTLNGGLLGGGKCVEDAALILGKSDMAIKNTADSADGRAFDDETERYLHTRCSYVMDNLEDIEKMLHHSVGRFNVTSGLYGYNNETALWEKISLMSRIREFLKHLF